MLVGRKSMAHNKPLGCAGTLKYIAAWYTLVLCLGSTLLLKAVQCLALSSYCVGSVVVKVAHVLCCSADFVECS